jgi:hypothetical protein
MARRKAKKAKDADRRAAESTIDALMYSLRRGPGALSDRFTMSRASELSEQQLVDVAARVQKFKPHIAPAWAPDQVEILIAAWRQARER